MFTFSLVLSTIIGVVLFGGHILLPRLRKKGIFGSYTDDNKPKYQSVDVGIVVIRIILVNKEIYDVSIQGRAIYAGKDVGILVEDAQKMFSKWREDGSKSLYRLEHDHWLSRYQVQDIFIVEKKDHFVNVRVR